MPADDAGNASQNSRLGQALDGLPRAGRRAVSLNAVGRFCKYAFLIGCALLTVRVVFDAYSFYVARRDIDTELRSKRVSSLEYLGVLTQRKRALAITALEGRCMERTQLTMFRILDAEHDRIKSAYNDMMKIKNKLVDAVVDNGPGLIDVKDAKDFVNLQRFSLDGLDEHLKPINPETGSSAKYATFKSKIAKLRDEYAAVAAANAPLRAEIESHVDKTMKELHWDPSTYWSMDEIQKVSDRNEQVRKELKEIKEQVGDIEDVMARYGVWTGALTGGAANSPVLDEIAYQIEKADAASLDKPSCKAFSDYYQAINNRVLRLDPLDRKKSWGELTFGQRIESLPRYYRQALLTYFNQPPAAQTLFVTMFLGALGALTLNILRMSKVGWWSLQDDPLWGEILVGPLLGALAAFGIFLVGSTGLLLTTEGSGAQPLSAYFIGLLGFLSGLLYDEAFGRVRRVGIQMFAARPDQDATNARAEDRSLAETLRGNNASQAASLVIKYGIGTRLSLESEFTLLVPSDTAMGRVALATWTALNDPQSGEFERWYHHRHAVERVARADVVGSTQSATVSELKVDDGETYALAAPARGEFTIANARVLIADIKWGKGVIHVLSDDLP